MRGQDFADLKAFLAIVDEGNFARAAVKLQVTPSALSQTIRGLEERLGVRLLNRTTRSTSLTEAGSRLLKSFRPAMEQMEESVSEIRNLSGKPAGLVRLNLPRLASAALVEPLLGEFHRTYPEIVLELTIDDAVIDIVKAGYDIGVTLGELLDQDMVAVKLGNDAHQLAVASPKYIARHGQPKTPADLHGHRCINWRQPGSGKIYNWEFQVDGRWISVAVDGPLIVSHRDVALKAAVQGVGIAFAYWSEIWMRPLIAKKQLIPVLEEFSPSFPGWFLYFPKQRYMSPAVRAVIDFLRDRHSGKDVAKRGTAQRDVTTT